jgi:hypothetical protein
MGCGSQVVETPTHFQCQAGIAKQAENEAKARDHEAAPAEDGKRRKRYKVPDEDKPCGFLVPRTVCKREITREEVMKILGPEKKTDLLTDFTSRFGRPFSAMLFLKENGRHGFEFAPRAPRGKAEAGADAEPGAEAAAPTAAKSPPKASRRKKAAAKKTPAKKAARKKA